MREKEKETENENTEEKVRSVRERSKSNKVVPALMFSMI